MFLVCFTITYVLYFYLCCSLPDVLTVSWLPMFYILICVVSYQMFVLYVSLVLKHYATAFVFVSLVLDCYGVVNVHLKFLDCFTILSFWTTSRSLMFRITYYLTNPLRGVVMDVENKCWFSTLLLCGCFCFCSLIT